MILKKDLKKRAFTSFILLFLLFLIVKSNLFLVFTLIILGVMSIIEFINLTNKIFKHFLAKLIFNIFFIIYIFSFSFLFFLLQNFQQLEIILFSLMIACVASDIGGFVFGKYFKGPKLTKVSPNKTISGAIGSLIFSTIIFSSIFIFYVKNFNLNIVLVGLLTSIACQCGDLIFSFLKRKAKVKDTGNFFPGHGGTLDRLDGILVGVPFGFIIIIVLI